MNCSGRYCHYCHLVSERGLVWSRVRLGEAVDTRPVLLDEAAAVVLGAVVVAARVDVVSCLATMTAPCTKA